MIRLLAFAASHKREIIRIFQVVYAGISVVILLGFYANFVNRDLMIGYYALGKTAGEWALYVFLVATVPGILGRFRLKHPILAILFMFRRQIGILMFFLTLMHAMLAFYFPNLAYGYIRSVLLPPPFVIVSSLAFILLLALTLTSNDWSVRKMGPWWRKLHRLVYVVFWLIFLHVALQKNARQSLLIGTAAVAEIASLLFEAYRRYRQRQELKETVPDTPAASDQPRLP